MSEKPSAGRPSKDKDRRAAPVSIEARHLDMLDEAIMDSEGRAPGLSDEDPPTVLAARRREFLGRLIEQRCSFEARHPVAVKIIAPIFTVISPHTDVAKFEVNQWLDAETERLTREAPAPVRDGFLRSKLARLRRDDPEKYADTMRAALEGASDDG